MWCKEPVLCYTRSWRVRHRARWVGWGLDRKRLCTSSLTCCQASSTFFCMLLYAYRTKGVAKPLATACTPSLLPDIVCVYWGRSGFDIHFPHHRNLFSLIFPIALTLCFKSDFRMCTHPTKERTASPSSVPTVLNAWHRSPTLPLFFAENPHWM